MKFNLSKRIFIITFILLISLMTATLLFQIMFFEKFYESKKQENLANSINDFKNQYSYNLSDSNTVANALNTFENSTNSKVGIFDLNGVLNTIEGNRNSDDTVNGLILKNLCNQIINNESLLNKIRNDNYTEEIIFYDQNTQSKKIGIVSALSIDSKNDSLIIVISSIQPIEEAASVISEFYIYIFIGFFFFTLLLSFIYSNLISKPLVNINNVATKLSNMDFSSQCNETYRSDEIGNLARTLNFLSTNLNNALEDLQKKNRQLQEDIEKERNIELMRKDFIASVSHDLKTPIGVIEGYAEGIKDGIVEGEDALIYLETIIDEAKKMGIMVSNMLELSKLESGALKPNPEIFNINRLIKKIINMLKIDAEVRNLNLIFIEKTEYSYVLADRLQMEQVITNLITNAIKYTPPENDIITTISEEKNKYKLSVLNIGGKIDPDNIKKVFDKFYRVDKSRNRKTNSTGLGLSIVKNILELHHFQFSLQNTDNGVEFIFYLPKQEMITGND